MIRTASAVPSIAERAIVAANPNSLPAMVMRASQRLAEARSSAEVLEVKGLAEAALHYAKVTGAANDTHADCLRIITRAEIRMASEIDLGQSNGTVAKAGSPIVRAADNSEATYSDLGISRQRVSEWREIRDAGEEKVEEAIQIALDEGRAPTKADIKNHVRGTFGTGENEWYTPEKYLDLAREVLGGIDLDPASSHVANRAVQAAQFFSEETNGLERDWFGKVWLNPPYAQPAIAHFADKMVAEWGKGLVEAAIVLTHNYTDTAWFHALAGAATAICFTRGRVRFVSPTGELAAPTQGQAFFYFGADVETFAAKFSEVGFVVEVRP